jgi:hypothetical protein
MKQYQQRVIRERHELNKKIHNLVEFMDTDTYDEIDRAEQKRLLKQLEIMTRYSNVLSDRIEAFK